MEVLCDTVDAFGKRFLSLRYTDEEKELMRIAGEQQSEELRAKLNQGSSETDSTSSNLDDIDSTGSSLALWNFNWYPHLKAIDLSTFFTVEDVAEFLPAWGFENKNDITINCSNGSIQIEAV